MGAHTNVHDIGKEVPDEKAEQQIAELDAMKNEKSTDDELGGGDMLAREQSREVASRLQLACGDGLAIELVERIHTRREVRELIGRAHSAFMSAASR